MEGPEFSMALHIIIDGYNLIRQSASLSLLDNQDIQAGREALIDRLANYRHSRPHKITVVFDGANAALGSDRRQRVMGIDVRYSRQGELADTVIKRMAARECEKALVVTSDRDVVTYAQTHGAATISSEQFEDRIALMAGLQSEMEPEAEVSGWRPDTRKKGPARRLSRKARRNRLKVDKL